MFNFRKIFFFSYQAPYIHSINSLFQPNENPPYPIPQTIHVPDANYAYQPNPYPNLYAVNQPYLTQHIILPEVTVDKKAHKWWSFHNLKEKFKSFFKHKTKHTDEIPNNSANLLSNLPQLQPGNR